MSHIIESPWQFDTQAIHKGRENTYEFAWMGKTVVLLPLTSPPSNKNSDKGNLFHLCCTKQLILEHTDPILGLIIKYFDAAIDLQDATLSPEIQTLLAQFPIILKPMIPYPHCATSNTILTLFPVPLYLTSHTTA